MPTGVALLDPREQLFEAAERLLVREGPTALTSRAVTIEAGVAKGVLHRHFTDFDAFLVELVLDRAARIARQADGLREAIGTRAVADNLTGALITAFDSVALGIVALLIFRDDLRRRLRTIRPHGVPVLSEVGAMVTEYLEAEREIGRIATNADLDTLALTLIGGGHLLFADREGPPPDRAAVHKMVTTVIAGAVEHPVR